MSFQQKKKRFFFANKSVGRTQNIPENIFSFGNGTLNPTKNVPV